MRIRSIEIAPLDLRPISALTVAYGNYALFEYALVKIVTDEGATGLGEASPDPGVTGETRSGVIAALERASGFLVGVDPFDIDYTISRCLEIIPAFPSAMAAIDMALYDLMGKSTNLPVCKLLGGMSRPEIGLYPVIPMDSPETMARVSEILARMGCATMKIKLGSDPDLDLRRLAAIRDAAGSGIRLRLDINQGWKDAATSIRVIRSLDGFNVEWIEQPVAARDIAGLAAVSAAVDLPIMADESCHSPSDLMEIIRSGAADMINVKLMKCGGLFRAMKMLAIAEAAGLPCVLGSMGESSIGSAAGLHLVAARPAIVDCELIGPLFIDNDPARGFRVDMSTFRASVSDRPGLGVELR